jgi:formate-dependent nitrite reductase membrane component NrfD
MTGDGRHIDPRLGVLEGEGSHQAVEEREPSTPLDVWKEVPDRGADEDTTYYDRPAIKEPVWIWAVPAYFYAGGTAGAAALLGAAAQLDGGPQLRPLVRRCRWVAAVSGAVGTGLLIRDLGRPERFLNMLRVFRPTSPMSMGSWVLAAEAPTTVASAVLAGANGSLGRVGDLAGLAAGALGVPQAGYTAVLVSNTAVPVWQATRRSLPALFMASAAAGAASVLDLFPMTARQARVVRRYGALGRVAELVAGLAVERDADRVERVGRPFHEGLSGSLWRAAKVLTGASLALSLVAGKSRGGRTAAGLLGSAGSLAVRFAVFHAGKASARDPRATFHQQRSGQGGVEVAGSAAVAGPGRERAV